MEGVFEMRLLRKHAVEGGGNACSWFPTGSSNGDTDHLISRSNVAVEVTRGAASWMGGYRSDGQEGKWTVPLQGSIQAGLKRK